jgi:hypothetical protein
MIKQRYHLQAAAIVTAEHHETTPGSEAGKPQNLLSPGEESWNKWDAPNHNHSWVEVDFSEKLKFTGIGFKSAGDHPRMAPTDVRIEIWHVLEGGWVDLGKRELNFGHKNWHTLEFPEIHGETKKVRFHFNNNRSEKGIQLGEIIFYHQGDCTHALQQPAAMVDEWMLQGFVQPMPQPVV